MRRTRWAAAIVAAAAVALTACSGTPAPAPAGEPSTLAAYYAQHLNWQPCDGGFECAQFVVPFDYAKPDGRAVHPAGGQAAGRGPGAPGRRAGHQPVRIVRGVVPGRAGLPARGLGGGLGGGSLAGAEAKVEALITRANSAALAARLDDGQVADGAMLLYGVADALYSRSSWPILKAALASAFTGDGTGLVELADQLYGRKPNGTYSTLANAVTAIDCLDRPWPRSLAAWQSAASTAEKAAPMFGAGIVWGSLTCAYGPSSHTRSRALRPPARRPSWSSARCGTRPRPTAGLKPWPPTWPPACCSAGTATVTPPTVKAAPASTPSSTTT